MRCSGSISIHRCNEIGKRSGEHFHAIPSLKTFRREQVTRGIASEHQTRDQVEVEAALVCPQS